MYLCLFVNFDPKFKQNWYRGRTQRFFEVDLAGHLPKGPTRQKYHTDI